MNLKENVVHLYNGTVHNSADKKHDIIDFSDKWIELETINLHEVTETQKDKHHCFLLNVFFFSFLLHLEYQEMVVGWGEWVFEGRGYKI